MYKLHPHQSSELTISFTFCNYHMKQRKSSTEKGTRSAQN